MHLCSSCGSDAAYCKGEPSLLHRWHIPSSKWSNPSHLQQHHSCISQIKMLPSLSQRIYASCIACRSCRGWRSEWSKGGLEWKSKNKSIKAEKKIIIKIYFLFWLVILTYNKENKNIEHPSVSNDHEQEWDIREPSNTCLAGVLILLVVIKD